MKTTIENSETDPAREIMKLLVQRILERLRRDTPEELTPAFFEMCRKFLTDNSVTLATVRRGDFGALAQQVAEEFPFDENGKPVGTSVM